MTAHLADLVSDNYPTIAKELVRPLIELLRLSRDLGSGDLERALVLYVIGFRTIEHEDFKRLRMADIVQGAVQCPPSLRTNARSVAASLGIPRESVRRKVQELVRAGLVVRSGHDLMLSGEGLLALAPVRSFLIALAVQYFDLVALLARARTDDGAARRLESNAGLAVRSRLDRSSGGSHNALRVQ